MVATETVDVVVVGAGAVGLATARELARAGHAPLVLERFPLPHRAGSSHGASRIVRLAHDRVDDVRDAQLAMDLWDRLERDTGQRLLDRVGGLEFGVRMAATEAALRACDVTVEVLDSVEVEKRFPGVRALGEDAVFQPDSAVVRADAAVAALLADARAHGSVVQSGVTVEALDVASTHVDVHTGGGVVRARSVVLAAGGWIAGLAAQVGVSLDARPTLQSPTYFRAGRPTPTVIDIRADGAEFYALPESSGSVVKGGLHDPGPLLELSADPGSPRSSFASDVAAFASWARERYCDLEPEPFKSDGCVYTWLPGSRFHLQRHDRVVVASCCSGRGFKFVPLNGRRAARLAVEVLGA
jgi:sarcosine oxidase